MKINFPPIALFVYNRIYHTTLTVEALKKNIGASESVLYIFSDGPKSLEDREKVLAVRSYIKDISGFADVRVVERDTNIGLAASIIDGVSFLVSKYGRVVVLEDDIVTSRYFLTYMNDALNKYSGVEKVMHIAAYMFPIRSTRLKETFFYRNTSCWGWGTWKRAWDKMETDADLLISKFSEEMRYRFNIDGTYDSWGILERTSLGKADSWAIRWYASVFLSNGICLHPSRSLTNNIGHDGSGVHCGVSSMYDVNIYEGKITEFEVDLTENSLALKRIRRYMLMSRIPTIKMVGKRLYKLLTKHSW